MATRNPRNPTQTTRKRLDLVGRRNKQQGATKTMTEISNSELITRLIFRIQVAGELGVADRIEKWAEDAKRDDFYEFINEELARREKEL